MNSIIITRRLVSRGAVLFGVVIASLLFFGLAQSAHAGVGLGVTPNFPSLVTVGDTGVPTSLTISNESDEGDGDPVDLTAITLVPSCGDTTGSTCTSPDPDVYDVSNGTGANACAGINFTASEIDATTGEIEFTPDSTVTLGLGEACTINFTVDVLKAPTIDAGVADGLQTKQIGFAEAVDQNNVDLDGFGAGTDINTVLDPTTDVNASVDLDAIVSGDEVTLTITETNDGNSDLSNPFVDLQPLGLTLDEASTEFTGTDTNSDGILSDGETWEWTVTDTPAGDTTYVATGHGTTLAGDDLTWCEDPQNPPQGVVCDQDERASTTVDVINPSTDVAITSSAAAVDVGGTVDLTVTETNDGDDDLTNPSVVVNDGSSDIATLTAAPDSGDVADPGVLNVGETWSWTISNVVVNSDTTFTATGHGTNSLGDDVTWTSGCEVQDPEPGIFCDPDEEDEVTVEVRFNPDTSVSASVNMDLVYVDDEVTLTITETNDGDVDLTDAYVDLQPLGATLDETHTNFSSDGNNDSTLDVGETWTWTVTDNPSSDTTYVAIGHGTDPDGNDVTYCEDPQNPPELTVCDQDERDEVSVDVIDPSTNLTITASETEVSSGDTVTLTVTEENDGDADLTNPFIDIDNGVGTFDETSSEFVGGDDGDGVLEVGETWTWDVDVTVDDETTYTAIGHGTDPLGNDVTYPADPDERDSVTIEVAGFAGCTPGYWKNHTDVWEGYSDGELFDDVFGTGVGSLGKGKKASDNPTLLDALSANGGGVNALARHAVAALLNAAHSLVEYPMSEGEVMSAVEAAIEAGDYDSLKNELEELNEEGCSIDAHGNLEDEEVVLD